MNISKISNNNTFGMAWLNANPLMGKNSAYMWARILQEPNANTNRATKLIDFIDKNSPNHDVFYIQYPGKRENYKARFVAMPKVQGSLPVSVGAHTDYSIIDALERLARTLQFEDKVALPKRQLEKEFGRGHNSRVVNDIFFTNSQPKGN